MGGSDEWLAKRTVPVKGSVRWTSLNCAFNTIPPIFPRNRIELIVPTLLVSGRIGMLSNSPASQEG